MHKILITKKQKDRIEDTDITYHLSEGYGMEIEKIKPMRNKFRFIKYYKVYVNAEGRTQKDVVHAFRFLGLFH